ncbi:PDDEXK nuclease domain-containing protein [Archangium violaceum]|uniref:PDDEXK nuclease domain-containing protein n=1 Tax=Archangium violaceum TaxID=83451 RepID=UPI002B317E28|nr:PDDEXK nuclease domain-containing protein [Archangium gephyra]
MSPRLSLPSGYATFLEELKAGIRQAQVRAVLAANSELILLYWRMGRKLLERQSQEGWGAQIIDRLSADLRRAFPSMKGFSVRNLKYMRTFAEAWPDERIVQQVVAQIPWGHHVRLLDRVRDPGHRLFYVYQALEHGWSRSVLMHQIEGGLHKRQGHAITHFARTLPPPQSDLAQQSLKDPYTLDFLSLGPELRERELERELLVHIRDFLLELGVGFAFVGSQVPIEVGRRDFYIDLLFYHLRLRCFVVIDLKTGDFEPEHAGKMNFYLSAVDDSLRHESDQPSIGLILCKHRDRVIVEYSLRDTKKPIGVSAYKLTERLPNKLARNLPSVQQLESELARKGKNRR